MCDACDSYGRASYAVRVRGRLGPLFLTAIPHRMAVLVEGRSIVVARVAPADLADLLRRISDVGLEIESAREVDEDDCADASPVGA